ncbi:hypothetical protein ACIRPK_20690 [Kitasatospora sp. NPDC101801]|uniref:hypothetical protein n=1 Tax=Kitasatospora sp. NPDC101801 TaxID=3364103 RepID=UPI0038302FA1
MKRMTKLALGVAAVVLAAAALTACSDERSDNCGQQPQAAAQLMAKSTTKPSTTKPSATKPSAKASKKPSKKAKHDHDDDCDD